MTPKRLITATLAAGLFVSLAAPCAAQDPDTLIFEEVGDQPIDADRMQFDSEGMLWAIEISALWRLSTAQQWEEIGSGFGHHMLVLSPDTLFRGTNAGTHRSVDGGQTYNPVYEEGGALFAAGSEGPNNGVILCGAHLGGTGIAYSTDQGASFTESTFTVSTSSRPFLESAVEILDGPAAGRLVAGVFAGVVISEDGGQTWAPSSLFQNARFWVQRVVIGTDPASGSRRLFASVLDAQEPNAQLYISDDDGLTWSNPYEFPWSFFLAAIPPPPNGDGTLLAVTGADGVVFRSEGGGQSWTEIGQVPFEFVGRAVNDVELGPDGKLYVSVGLGGPEREWVYRTTEPVVVANEPGPELPEPAAVFQIYPNPATDRITVEASGMSEEVVLYDLLGRAVRRVRLIAGKAVLDTARLPAGVYVVRAGVLSRLVTVRR